MARSQSSKSATWLVMTVPRKLLLLGFSNVIQAIFPHARFIGMCEARGGVSASVTSALEPLGNRWGIEF